MSVVAVLIAVLTVMAFVLVVFAVLVVVVFTVFAVLVVVVLVVFAVLEMMMGATEFEFEVLIFPPMTPSPKRRAKVMAARARRAAMAQQQG